MPSRPGPCHVPVKACCGAVLVGEECDCAEFAAEFERAMRQPIQLTNAEALAVLQEVLRG